MKPGPALREGFTTGSAASAATFAAVSLLLSPSFSQESVSIALPPLALENGALHPQSEKRLAVPLLEARLFEDGRLARAQVLKDGGDDPDATHGLLMEVWAAKTPEDIGALAGKLGATTPALPLEEGVFLTAGPGVGRVTLPGLPVPPGQAAVNPAPRRQIAFAAREAARAAAYSGPIHLFLQVPEGEKAAAKTLNARLGILGGISILGTRGTVRPYSHEAWQATIAQGLDIARALGLESVAFSTGRNSELALQGLFPALPPQAFIQAADYAWFSIDRATNRACGREFGQIIWGCYPGKLLKLEQGLKYTHAKSAPPDLARLAALVRQSGQTDQAGQTEQPRACAALADELSALPTVRGAFERLEEADPALALNILKLVATRALHSLSAWAGFRPGRICCAGGAAQTGKANRPAPRITLCVFRNHSPEHSLWLRADAYD